MIDLQTIGDLQAINDALNSQIRNLESQVTENDQKIQALRLITDSVDMLDYGAVKVKQAVANIYDVKADRWAEIVDKVLDEKQKELIKSYATKELIAPVSAASIEDIKG